MANQEITPLKFDLDAKRRFLTEFAATGRVMHSAACADVCRTTVTTHLQDDPEFATAYDEAIQVYRESVQAEVRRRAFGWLEPVYHQGSQGFTVALDEHGRPVTETVLVDEYVAGAEGESPRATGRKVEITRNKMVPAFIRRFSDKMLELEAKRTDPAYREKAALDLTVKGGVLVVPGMFTATEEEAAFREQERRRVIDITPGAKKK